MSVLEKPAPERAPPQARPANPPLIEARRVERYSPVLTPAQFRRLAGKRRIRALLSLWDRAESDSRTGRPKPLVLSDYRV